MRPKPQINQKNGSSKYIWRWLHNDQPKHLITTITVSILQMVNDEAETFFLNIEKGSRTQVHLSEEARSARVFLLSSIHQFFTMSVSKLRWFIIASCFRDGTIIPVSLQYFGAIFLLTSHNNWLAAFYSPSDCICWVMESLGNDNLSWCKIEWFWKPAG